jgi:hypothetical protein
MEFPLLEVIESGMPHDHPPLHLILNRLPARVDVQGASELLSLAPGAISILVARGYLKPLGNPLQNEHIYFSPYVLLKLAEDEKWLNQATRALVKHWAKRKSRRGNKKSKSMARNSSKKRGRRKR